MRTRWLAGSLGAGALLFTADAAQATDYYVDSTNGLDSNTGTQAAPWRTLSKVNATALAAGDRVRLRRGGLWAETLRPTGSGTEGNPIVFEDYGDGERPMITGTPNTSCITWSAPRSHLTFRNLHLQDCGQPSGGNAGGMSVWSEAGVSTGITMEGSLIERAHRWNVYLSGVSTLTLRGNVLRDARLEHGIYLDGTLGLNGALLEGNEFSGNANMCVQLNSNGEHRLTGVVIRYNVLHDCGAGGLNNIGAEAALVHHNLFYGAMPGIYDSCDGADVGCSAGARGGVYVNNTIVTSGSGWASCFSSGSSLGSPSFAAFVNNICLHDAASGAAFEDDETSGSPEVTHNLFYSSAGDVAIVRRGSWYSSFTAYQSAFPQDEGALFADPLLVDVAGTDFRLLAGSPAVDSARDWGFARDLAGTAVPSGDAPDRGALELPVASGGSGGGSAGGSGGATGTAGAIATGGNPAGGGGAVPGGSPAVADDASDEGGCGCRVVDRSGCSLACWALGVPVALLALRRKRRRGAGGRACCGARQAEASRAHPA